MYVLCGYRSSTSSGTSIGKVGLRRLVRLFRPRDRLRGAQMSALFHVEALGQWRQPRFSSAKLISIFQNDFRAAIVFLELSANIDHAPSKLPHVAYILDQLR
jgi:hypothetical protein